MKSSDERASTLATATTKLARVQRAYRVAADRAVAHIGLSQALAWPLVMIGRHGNGMRQGTMAELLGIEGPSLVRSLDQLVSAGLVERHDDAADRRAKTLHLTPAGSAARAHIEEALHALRADLFADVADTDIDACVRVLSALEHRLGRAKPLQRQLRAAMEFAKP